LELLPCVAACSAFLHFLIAFILLLFVAPFMGFSFQFKALFAPIVLLPLFFTSLGISFIFSSIGVYIKDLSQALPFISTAALFLSPIFYKISDFPATYQNLFYINPITLPVDQLRALVLWGISIDWCSWFFSLLIGVLIFLFGLVWFRYSKKGFSDVV
jgi:lipopolysaccharide transport system permease protein